MQRSFFLALLVFVVFATSVTTTVAQSSVGVGVGFYSYTTAWYRYNSGASPGLRETYPWHMFTRTQALIYYESPPVISIDRFKFSLLGEFHYGISGDTKEDWLPLGESISSGGTTIAAAAGVKLYYPFQLRTFTIAPYVAPLFHYTLLDLNGEGVGTQYANRAQYGYIYGWSENLFAFSLGLGIQMKIDRIVVSPEYRFFIAGGVSTDWEPTGWVEPYTPDFHAFIIKLGLTL